MRETSFVMIKPDGVQRGLVGEVIRRLEAKGLRLVALKMLRISREMAETHYREHQGKPFYEGLMDFITSGPVVAMAWRGPKAVSVIRKVMGPTDPAEAPPGTIRGDYGLDVGQNIVHGSDSPESAQRELDLFFSTEELVDYTRSLEPWVAEDFK